MDSLALLIAALAASAALSVPAERVASSDATSARRSEGGAEATARVTVRIISQSARIGDGYPAPQAGMTLRPAQLAAADGSFVPALVYDFE